MRTKEQRSAAEPPIRWHYQDDAFDELIDRRPAVAFLAMYAVLLIIGYGVGTFVPGDDDRSLWLIMLGPPTGALAGRRRRKARRARMTPRSRGYSITLGIVVISLITVGIIGDVLALVAN